ncbi:MAG: tetratricopeptide repeat protein [Methylacidiphilales bacterium]|nr:tetratricopeptide repeat protein [Candidatus Methylacidiphilales bacterium]
MRSFRLLQAAILALAGWWAFAPALTGGWIWDDTRYLPDNILLHDPARLWKTWFAPGTFYEYYPLTATVQFIQWSLWGNETPFYHVTNMALHIVNAFLVWKLFEKLGLRLAWLGGMIFAVHPLTVESVAWISELKNTLSLAPFLLAMIFYVDYEEQGRERDYWLSLGLFLIAMLAKTTMAPFPAVILLYAWWKRGRIGLSDLRAATPFLVISTVLVTLTVLSAIWYVQVFPEIDKEPPEGGWAAGPASAGLAIFFFASKFFWPTGLMLIYPRWLEAGVSPPDFLPWIALTAAVGWLWWKRREGWSRGTLLGLGFFLIMLMPVLSMFLVRDTSMVRSLDHLVYLPMIGLTGLTVAGLEAISARFSVQLRCAGTGILAVALVLMAWESHAYAVIFQNEEGLWKFTVQQNPGSAEAHYNLGNMLIRTGHVPEAVQEYRAALRLNPDHGDAHTNLGNALLQLGQVAAALPEYSEALRINPNDADVHTDLGVALAMLNRLPEARIQFEEALRLDPHHATAQADLSRIGSAGNPADGSKAVPK